MSRLLLAVSTVAALRATAFARALPVVLDGFAACDHPPVAVDVRFARR